MWAIIGSLVVCLIIFFMELPTLWKQKQFKEMSLYLLLILTAMTVYILNNMHVSIPNPLDWMTVIIEQLGLAIS